MQRKTLKRSKGLYKDANQLLGNIVKVTPSSKVVGDFAIFMFKNGLTKENILEVGKDLSYPDSVVEYFVGNDRTARRWSSQKNYRRSY